MSFAEAKSLSDRARSSEARADEGMLYVPGGTYRMGSDRHYPEEAPIDTSTSHVGFRCIIRQAGAAP
jgi:formylglycine-generating enzyme required for sulfatase activity